MGLAVYGIKSPSETGAVQGLLLGSRIVGVVDFR